MVSNFLAILNLATPAILNRNMMGDSMLIGFANEAHGDPIRAIREVPIARTEGVAHASMMFISGVSSRVRRTASFVRSPMRDMHDPDIIEMLDEIPPKSSLSTQHGDFRSFVKTYDLIDARALFFFGRGDMDAVEYWLGQATNVGSQRHKGYGQISNIDLIPMPDGNEWFAIVGVKNGRNTMLRTFPQRLRHLLPDDVDHMIAHDTWCAPYNSRIEGAVVEPCLSPIFNVSEDFEGEESDLCRMI
jgi:CRISPR type IV-associated protein Csf3